MSTDDPIHKAASLAAWGALRQRHYATVDEVFDALASDVVAAVRPLIEADERKKIAAAIRDQENAAVEALNASGGNTLLSGYANALHVALVIAEGGAK